jgi:pimeloyl-ACP methyl ester carboxylesterase
MSLRAPPKNENPSRAVGRMIFLIVLVLAAGIVIYTAVTNQRIDLTEGSRIEAVELDDSTTVEGVRMNVVDSGAGALPVVVLHDVDATGGMILSDLAAALSSGGFRAALVDLPGFGYSDRLPDPGAVHTAAGTGELVAGLIESRFVSPVVVVGVGFGGKVGAELAHSYPELIAGLVMVDVDFWGRESFEVGLQELPWVGRAATFTWETGGRFALDSWSPYCDQGGWCPSDEQLAARGPIIEIVDTTDSIWAFRRTPPAGLAPANFAEIAVPAVFVWSSQGPVPQENVDRVAEEMTALAVVESSSFQAHLEDTAAIVEAVTNLVPPT